MPQRKTDRRLGRRQPSSPAALIAVENGEKWAAVAGYEGVYEVSDLGRVRSLDRVVIRHQVDTRLRGQLLRPALGSHGYSQVVLCNARRRRTCCVHVLVAQAFIANPQGLPQVNHKDGVKTNSVATNLEWCTSSQNLRHAFDLGLSKPRGGGKRKSLNRQQERTEHYV